MSASICHRCGTRVVQREFGAGLTMITISQLVETAYWCEHCAGVVCGRCGGLEPPKGQVSFMLGTTAFCAVCKQAMEPAAEAQMTAAMSPRLRKATTKPGLLSKLFGKKPQPPGSLAYMFTVTTASQPSGPNGGNEYLFALKQRSLGDAFPISETARFAAVWDTEPVDRAQLVNWASEVFKIDFATLSTAYVLTFIRYEHESGSGQALIALHPGAG